MDHFGNAGSCQQRRFQVLRRSRRQNDRQVWRELTQFRGKIEGARARLVTHERRVEACARRTGLHGLLRPGEADFLVTECRQNFLMLQQALAVGLKHQHGFTDTATSGAGCTLSRYRRKARNRRKPDIETCSGPWGALHLQPAIVLQNNVACGGKPKTIAVQARRKERLKIRDNVASSMPRPESEIETTTKRPGLIPIRPIIAASVISRVPI
jgi:hypothetical protein